MKELINIYISSLRLKIESCYQVLQYSCICCDTKEINNPRDHQVEPFIKKGSKVQWQIGNEPLIVKK